jgi:hypothetical protein
MPTSTDIPEHVARDRRGVFGEVCAHVGVDIGISSCVSVSVSVFPVI